MTSGEGSIAQVLSGEARWNVTCGDCLEVLPTLADGCVDHVICDPPYDAKTHHNAKTSKGGGGSLNISFPPLENTSFAPSLLRVAKQWAVCFCALEQIGVYAAAFGDAWVRAGIWNRLAGTAFARADRPFQGAEGIAIASAAKVKRFPAGARRAVWDCTTERDPLRGHPTAKPLDLMIALVGDFACPQDLILDPFAGSGTTGVAALRLGRRVILIEREPKWADLCRERLRAEENGSTLAASRAGQVPLFNT